MKVCANCGAQLQDNAVFCPHCGASCNPATGQSGVYPGLLIMPYDHTAEFDPRDVSDNKVICMAVYLMGVMGTIIAMLASGTSPYVAFHVRQALKITVLNTLVGICSLALLIVPLVNIAVLVALLIWQVVVLVVRVICFANICSGKAVEPPIVRSVGFLK